MKAKVLVKNCWFQVCLWTAVGFAWACWSGEKTELPSDPQEEFAYALGVNLAANLSRLEKQFTEQHLELLKKGYLDAISGKAPIDEVKAREIIRDFQVKAFDELAETNLARSKNFLEENKKRPGVRTTASGLQYQVIEEGAGEPPGQNDIVTVHYRGMLPNGKEFDSSYKRGEPTKFVVGRTIRGWQEALKMMKPGARWRIWVPPDLGYGKSVPPNVGPNQVLVFDIELLGVEKQEQAKTNAPMSQPTPITSDIIRIPSKEELEKGAKPEIIKPEQLKKLIEEEQKKQGQAKPEQ